MRAIVAALLLLLSHAAFADDTAKIGADLHARYLAALDEPGDAASALSIAQFLASSPFEDEAMQSEVAARMRAGLARARATDDPWLAAQALRVATDHAARAHWLAVIEREATANAWFALVRASQPDLRDEPASVARWIGVAAAAPRLETAHGREYPALYARFGGHPDASFATRANAHAHAAGLEVVGSPAIGPWLRQCYDPDDARRASCLLLGRKLQGADTVFHARLGNVLVERLGAPDEAATAKAGLRRLAWLRAIVPFASSELASPGDEEYLAAFATSEIEAFRAFRRARGEPVEPPADWTDAPPGD